LRVIDIQGEEGFPIMQYPRGVTMQSQVKFMVGKGVWEKSRFFTKYLLYP
jgi:hypothetical protein